MTPLVHIRGLRKDYQALRPLRVSALALGPGEIVSIGGMDALAAEMLVSLLTGAALPDEGEVRLFDRSTSEIPDADEWLALLDGVGLVTARAVLIEQFSVRQNLALPFTLAVDPIAEDVRPRVDAVADEVGVLERERDVAVGAAGAEVVTRVRLGRALALGPRLLLAEHPTADLPRDRAAAFGEDLARIARARGLAVLAITADEPFARALGGRRLAHQPATGACAEPGFWGRMFGG